MTVIMLVRSSSIRYTKVIRRVRGIIASTIVVAVRIVLIFFIGIGSGVICGIRGCLQQLSVGI